MGIGMMTMTTNKDSNKDSKNCVEDFVYILHIEDNTCLHPIIIDVVFNTYDEAKVSMDARDTVNKMVIKEVKRSEVV
jgi:hypothetical protein